jgi:hypothetical protein
MDKREFVQRFVIENYKDDGQNSERIVIASDLFNEIEERFKVPVNPTNLWDYNDK